MRCFRSKAGADVLMLDAPADAVLQALGREPAADGIFLPEQIPAALAAFAAFLAPPPPTADAEPEECVDPPPGLSQRAWPLLELLRAAARRGHAVTWSSP